MLRTIVKNKSSINKLSKELETIRKNHRKFLTFSTINFGPNSGKKNSNFPNVRSIISVYTDFSGKYEYLATISLEDFAKVAEKHFDIIYSKKLNEQDKLKKLVKLWRPIDDKISGYLFGDLSEESVRSWKP